MLNQNYQVAQAWPILILKHKTYSKYVVIMLKKLFICCNWKTDVQNWRQACTPKLACTPISFFLPSCFHLYPHQDLILLQLVLNIAKMFIIRINDVLSSKNNAYFKITPLEKYRGLAKSMSCGISEQVISNVVSTCDLG